MAAATAQLLVKTPKAGAGKLIFRGTCFYCTFTVVLA